MSSVYARNRSETELAFYVYGQQLQVELTKYVMKEKIFPKKWRYIVGISLIAKVDELMDNIVFANSIYPTTEEELETRKKYHTKAIANCYQIQNKLLRLQACLETATIQSLTNIIELLNKEMATLKSWKKSSKLIK